MMEMSYREMSKLLAKCEAGEMSYKELRRKMSSPDLTTLTHRNQLGSWLNEAGLTGLGCEIGVQAGENAEAILQTWRGHGLFLIDPWKQWAKEEYHDETRHLDWAQAHVETMTRLVKYPGRSIVLRMTSDEAAGVIPDASLDFIYIDGNHGLPQVKRDLVNYWPKVKANGLFAGHDYLNRDSDAWRCDVKLTVDEFVRDNGLALHVIPDVEGVGHPSWAILK